MFKFRHFNHFLFYNPRNVSIQPISNPLIDYTWSTQINSGNMELIDSGDTPAFNATLYSGKGILTDSTHYLDLTGLISGATSMIFYKDGVATYTETLFYLFNNGTYKDLLYFSRSLTTNEQSQYSTDPNGFFEDVRNGTITGCVFNSPLDGTDAFVKDYQNYTEGAEQYNDTYSSVSGGESSTITSIANGYNINITSAGTDDLRPKITLNYSSNSVAGNILVSFDYEVISGDVLFYGLHTGSMNYTNKTLTGSGTYFGIFSESSGRDHITQYISGKHIGNVNITNFSSKSITGLYEITNYTTSVRDTTSTLPYGTQSFNFTKDANGWRIALSSYLELDNINGHADTGYTPSGTVQIEEVDTIGTTDTHRVYQSDGNKFTNGQADGTFTIPASEIILKNTNLEGTLIDRYKLYRVYDTLNDAGALYNSYKGTSPISSPVFTSSPTTSSAENQTTAITLQATDTTSYSISGTDSALFDVNSSSGAVTFKTAPDYENPSDSDANNVYNFTATATGAGGSTNQSVSITVTDVAETPVFTSLAVNNVQEGQTSAITLVASDTTSYSISGTDSALFNVDANTGVVTFKTAPSYASPSDSGADNVYDFTATATGAGGSTNQSVSITVTEAGALTVSGIIADLYTKLAAKKSNFNLAEESPSRTYGAEYYVATDGSDSNDGLSISTPFLTFEKARDTIRTNGVPTNGVCVWVRGGTYYRTTTFVLDANDKGTQANPIHYRRYPNEKPIISGGKAIDPANFSVVTSGDYMYSYLPDPTNTYVCDLNALGFSGTYGNINGPSATGGYTHTNYMELFIDGEAQRLARYPKKGQNTETIPLVTDLSIRIYSDNPDVDGTYTRADNTDTAFYNPPHLYKWVKQSNNYILIKTDTDSFNLTNADGSVVYSSDWTTPLTVPRDFRNNHDTGNGGGTAHSQTITDNAIIQGFMMSGSRPDNRHFTYYGTRPETWFNQDIHIASMFAYGYVQDIAGMSSITTGSKTIEVDRDITNWNVAYAPNRNNYWYAFNVINELSEDGEYYIDRTHDKLYVHGNPAGKTLVVTTTIDDIILFDGCEWVQFEGIDVADGRGLLINMKTGRNNRFYKSKLANTGGAIAQIGYLRTDTLDNNVFDCGFDYCEFANAGSYDLKIYGGDRRLLVDGNNYITNCKVHDGGRLWWVYRGINIDGCGNKVTHNFLYNHLGGVIYPHGNEATIEYNYIHDVLQCASDIGAIYGGRSWSERGNDINYNFFSNIKNYRGEHSLHCIYWDDGLAGNSAIGNIVDNMEEDFIFSNFGRDHVIKYNIAQNTYNFYSAWPSGHSSLTNTNGIDKDPLRKMEGVYHPFYNPETINYRSAEWQAKYPDLYNLLPWDADQTTQWNMIFNNGEVAPDLPYRYPHNIDFSKNAVGANVPVFQGVSGSANGANYKVLETTPTDVNDASFVLTDTSLIGPNV